MRRPGPEEWKTLLAEYEASGLTQKEFAAKHDVSVNTLQYWLYRRLKRKSVLDSETSANFVGGCPARS
jgi:transposase-like protein